MTGFSMMATLAVNELKQNQRSIDFPIKDSSLTMHELWITHEG